MSDKLTTASSKTGDNTHSPVNDRRNFIKKGALAAPLIASVASRPVWACSVSGHMSGNLSHHSADACTAPANAMNWSYWAQWETVYNFINDIPGNRTWADARAAIDGGSPDLFTNSERNDPTSPVNALYNWYLADVALSGALAPTDGTTAGTISAKGAAISDMSAMQEMRFVAGLLNAAHPSIEFPYSSNLWTAQYISDKFSSAEDAASLDELLEDFFYNTIQPSGLGIIQAQLIGNAKRRQAYKLSREYLFGISRNDP